MRAARSILGNSQQLDGGAMFGNAPKALWSRWLTPDADNRITLACRALLICDEGRNILFETGIGAFFEPTLRERYGVRESRHILLDSLQHEGLAARDIDIVVLSHLHFDHAGGLLSLYAAGEAPRLVFERAHFVVGDAAWQRARAPHARDRASFIPALGSLLEASGRLHVVTGDRCELLGEGFRFFVSSGHTPGMLVSQIELPDGPIVFAADLIPGTAWVHVPITMGYDRYPELLIDEKQALLTWVCEHEARVFYTHDPAVAVSRIAVDDRGRYVATHACGELRT